VTVPAGSVSPNDQIGWSPVRGPRSSTRMPEPARYTWPLVVERDRPPRCSDWPAAATHRPGFAGSARGSSGSALGSVEPCARRLAARPALHEGSPCRRAAPSLIVAWRSTVWEWEERIHACTAPAPITVVFELERARENRTPRCRVAAGVPLIRRASPSRGPPEGRRAVSPVKSVSGRAVGVPRERVRPGPRRAWHRQAPPPGAMYQEAARSCPGIGKAGPRLLEAGLRLARPCVPPAAVVEQHADRRQLLERRQGAASVGGLQLDRVGRQDHAGDPHRLLVDRRRGRVDQRGVGYRGLVWPRRAPKKSYQRLETSPGSSEVDVSAVGEREPTCGFVPGLRCSASVGQVAAGSARR